MSSDGYNLTARYALQQADTLKKRFGRPRILTRNQREELVEFVCPPYPLDLNPIEALWMHTKEYLTAQYSDYQFETYEVSRAGVREAWEKVVASGLLQELIENMPSSHRGCYSC